MENIFISIVEPDRVKGSVLSIVTGSVATLNI